MSKREKTGSSKKRAFFLLNLVVLFFLVIAFGREYVGNIQVQHEIKQLEAQRQELETDQLGTLNLIRELSSEYYLESEARLKHGLGKEGETLIVVKDAAPSHGDVLGAQTDLLEQSPNIKRWYYYFFDHDSFDGLVAL